MLLSPPGRTGSFNDYRVHGMNDMLQKPFTVDALKEQFDKWTPFGQAMGGVWPPRRIVGEKGISKETPCNVQSLPHALRTPPNPPRGGHGRQPL